LQEIGFNNAHNPFNPKALPDIQRYVDSKSISICSDLFVNINNYNIKIPYYFSDRLYLLHSLEALNTLANHCLDGSIRSYRTIWKSLDEEDRSPGDMPGKESPENNDTDNEKDSQQQADKSKAGSNDRSPGQPGHSHGSSRSEGGGLGRGPSVTKTTWVFKSGMYSSEPSEFKDNSKTETGMRGVEIVSGYEEKQGRTVEDVQKDDAGYDLVSRGKDDTRYIEVKTISSVWEYREVIFTKNEYEASRRLLDQYWIYVVELTDKEREPEITPIQNPYGLITHYSLDKGWKCVVVPKNGQV
jgi:hypothetical protein